MGRTRPHGWRSRQKQSTDPIVHEAQFNRAVTGIVHILSKEFGMVIPANKVEAIIDKKFQTLSTLFHEAHDAKGSLENTNKLPETRQS